VIFAIIMLIFDLEFRDYTLGLVKKNTAILSYFLN